MKRVISIIKDTVKELEFLPIFVLMFLILAALLMLPIFWFSLSAVH